MLFRKDVHAFAPSNNTNDGGWKRSVVDIRAGITATGGKNIELSSVSGIGLRFQVRNTSAGNTQVRNVYLVSATKRTKISTTTKSYPLSGVWMGFENSLGYPLDLTGYQYVEFEWSYDVVAKPIVGLYINSTDPTATTRFYSNQLVNWRSAKVNYVTDFSHAHMASVKVDLFGYDGGDHQYYRDVIMLPNEVIWVRDSFEYRGDVAGDFKVGPLWHVGDSTSSANEWVNTRSYSPKAKRSSYDRKIRLFQLGPKRDLLIVMPKRPTYPNCEVVDSPGSRSGRNEIVLQEWAGPLSPGQRIAFNSFLMPHEADLSEAELDALASEIDLISDDGEVAEVKYRDWTLIANPYGKMIDLPNGVKGGSGAITYRVNDEGEIDVTYKSDE